MVRSVSSIGCPVPGVGDGVLVGLLLGVGRDDVGGAQVHPDGGVGLESPLGAPLVDVAPVRHLHLDDVLDLLQFFLLDIFTVGRDNVSTLYIGNTQGQGRR